MSEVAEVYQFPVAVMIVQDERGREVLLADERELADYKRQLDEQKEELEARKGRTTDEEQLFLLGRMIQKAEERYQAYLDKHERLLKQAKQVVYTLSPYSWYERVVIQD